MSFSDLYQAAHRTAIASVNADEVVISGGNILAYTGLHVLLFLFMGCMVALMCREFETSPHFGTAYLFFFVTFEIVVFGVQIAMMPTIIGTIGTLATALGSTISALAMYFFMLHRYPESWSYLVRAWRGQRSKGDLS